MNCAQFDSNSPATWRRYGSYRLRLVKPDHPLSLRLIFRFQSTACWRRKTPWTSVKTIPQGRPVEQRSEKMNRPTFGEIKDCSITLAGVIGLQLPCLVSRASPKSPFAMLQSLGFPFNMSAVTLNKHFAFSPENLSQGRHYTLVTNLFHHVGKFYIV